MLFVDLIYLFRMCYVYSVIAVWEKDVVVSLA
jgi:hypothetical protein